MSLVVLSIRMRTIEWLSTFTLWCWFTSLKAERAISVLVNMGAEDKNTKYSR